MRKKKEEYYNDITLRTVVFVQKVNSKLLFIKRCVDVDGGILLMDYISTKNEKDCEKVYNILSANASKNIEKFLIRGIK